MNAVCQVNPLREGGKNALYNLWNAIIKHPRSADELTEATNFRIEWIRELELFNIVAGIITKYSSFHNIHLYNNRVEHYFETTHYIADLCTIRWNSEMARRMPAISEAEQCIKKGFGQNQASMVE